MQRQRLDPNELCDAEFLASLEHLRLVARRVAPRGFFAEQRSRDKGAGIEFKDYRPYSAGDDLRGIDWNVYRRLGRVFLRLFEELEDLPLYLLPDVSASAWLEDPPRVTSGLRCALALAAISLGQHDRVGVFPFAEDLRVLVRPSGGKGRVLGLAQRVSEVEPGETTNIEQSLATFAGLGLREGLVCVISDFFDPRGIDAVCEALSRVRHRLLLVRLVRASDRDPHLEGDVRLVDCESGAVEDVSITAHVVERYKTAYARFEEKLLSFAQASGAGLLELDCDSDVVAQLESLFGGGAYAA